MKNSTKIIKLYVKKINFFINFDHSNFGNVTVNNISKATAKNNDFGLRYQKLRFS